jgi:hypothetical protein
VTFDLKLRRRCPAPPPSWIQALICQSPADFLKRFSCQRYPPIRFPGPLTQRPNVLFCARSPSLQFPAAANLAANVFSRSLEFCKFCPKSADLGPYAGKGAGISGNLPVNRFWEQDLRATLCDSPGAQQGNGRECRPGLWSALFRHGLGCQPIATLGSPQTLNRS